MFRFSATFYVVVAAMCYCSKQTVYFIFAAQVAETWHELQSHEHTYAPLSTENIRRHGVRGEGEI